MSICTVITTILDTTTEPYFTASCIYLLTDIYVIKIVWGWHGTLDVHRYRKCRMHRIEVGEKIFAHKDFSCFQ